MWNISLCYGVIEVHFSSIVLSVADSLSSLLVAALNRGSNFFAYPFTLSWRKNFFSFLRILRYLYYVPNKVVRCQRLVLEVSLVGGWSGLREIVRDSGDSDRFES